MPIASRGCRHPALMYELARPRRAGRPRGRIAGAWRSRRRSSLGPREYRAVRGVWAELSWWGRARATYPQELLDNDSASLTLQGERPRTNAEPSQASVAPL